MNVACPRCASLDTLGLPLLQQEGLTTVHGGVAGVGLAGFVGRGHRGTASGPWRTRAQTVLSRRIAPPRKRNVSGWLLLAIVCGTLFLLSLPDLGVATLAYVGIAGVGTWRVQANHAYNTAALPGLLSRWEQSRLCNRCGEVFEPT